MSILELKNIKKSYFLGKEEFPVLKGLALSFDKGDFVSILGDTLATSCQELTHWRDSDAGRD